MRGDVVVGLDGGGTRTRAVVAGLDGRVLSVAERGGASTEHNDPRAARANLRESVTAALTAADRSSTDVAAMTAGVAGLNAPVDYEEASAFLDFDAIPVEPAVVNDSVVAHAGALTGDPGVVPICGTGSIVLGVTTAGRRVRNYDCNHYARAAARHVAGRALHGLLAGATDWDLGKQLLDGWDCDDVSSLRRAVREDEQFSTAESGNALDRAAPLVTAAAADGDGRAMALCDDAVDEVETGVRCVGGYLDADPVPVAPAGSVLRSDYLRAELRRRFESDGDYRVVEPTLSPVAGAAFDAIDRIEDADASVARRLTHHPVGRP